MSALGSAALGLLLVAALAAAAQWAVVARADGAGTAAARRLALLPLGGAALVFSLLEAALISHDFGVRFVAENGARTVPLYYTVTSLWSGLSGSLVLWLLILSVCVTAFARRDLRGPAARLQPAACAIATLGIAGFAAIAMFGANPFTPVRPAPADGPGPNPLLQVHPAMGIHPPLLYLGYAATTVPFALALSALLRGDRDGAWILAARRWVLLSWTALGAGIVLGAWWSYAVLGWGGWWGWDPVENAALLPWLTSTALLHGIAVQRRTGALRAWNSTLAISGFLLTLLGTYLTRSGALASVHAFTTSHLGPLLLAGLLVTLGLTAALSAARAGSGAGRAASTGTGLSRGTALFAASLLLAVLVVTVLVGTLYPLLVSSTNGSQAAVGATWFDQMAGPPALLLLALMAAGPVLPWKGGRRGGVAARLSTPIICGAGACIALVAFGGAHSRGALIAVGLVAAVLATSTREIVEAVRSSRRARVGAPRRRIGAHIAHAGLAAAAGAVALGAGGSSHVESHLAVGGSVVVAGTSFTLGEVSQHADASGSATTATVMTGSHALRAELRYFAARDVTAAMPGIRSALSGDDYVTLLEADADGRGATLRFAVNPWVPELWAAGAVTVLGGIVAATPRRSRARRPPPRRQDVTPAPAPEEPADATPAVTAVPA